MGHIKVGDMIIVSHHNICLNGSVCRVMEVSNNFPAYCYAYKVLAKDGSIFWADGFLHSPLMEELV